MKNIPKILKAIFENPLRIPLKIFEKLPFLATDKFFLKLLFKDRMGYSLDFNNPRTFNEKLNWLKVYYRKPIMNILVDKYEVKKYVSDLIGNEFIIPSLGIWNSFDEIDFNKLPNQFVLKTTHDGGGIVICRDKMNFDKEKAKTTLNKHLKSNHYHKFREWPYKDVKPRILAEKYMEDKKVKELRDFKFFCFDGVPKALFVASDRQKAEDEVKFDYFDANFNKLNIRQSHPNSTLIHDKPSTFDEMKEKASLLSKTFPHVRVDFYEVEGQIYFGELTFYHYAGIVPFIPEKWDKIFGEWIKLPKIK